MIDGSAPFSVVSHLVGACASASMAVWLMGRRKHLGDAGTAVVVALALTASWALTAAATASDSAGAALAESFRNLAWLYVLWRLFRWDGRDALVKPVRPVVAALAATELLEALILVLLHRPLEGAVAQQAVFSVCVALRLIHVIGSLVLVHNLYSGASQQARMKLRWPAAALAMLWIYDLNLYLVAYLGGEWPAVLGAFRGLVAALAACLFIPAVARQRDELHFGPSRALTFRFAALTGIGAYIVGMVLVARSLEFVGGDYARLLQTGVLIAASTLAVLTLPSRKLRGWLRVTLVKHLFRHRYDYRTEWLRFAQTIGRGGESALPIEERAVQALAQITDSPAGLLLAPGDDGEFALSGRWQWPASELPAGPLPLDTVRFLEGTSFVVELDAVRGGESHKGEAAVIPDWLLADPRAWAMVPLIHHDHLTGVVVLARPDHVRKLDWEDFDLLRVVGQQLAVTLAENASNNALAEAAQFDEFHRRIAFVMHDIKNLASQFGLLARNAEMHADKPAFRADMLVTLRNSADKLNALIARLSRYGAGGADALAEFDVGNVVRQVAKHFPETGKITLTECRGAMVVGNRDALEQALIHLVQNAIDASRGSGTPVFVAQTSDGMHALVEVMDQGAGMSPEFVRNRLFRPFVSSKPGGFGIGAFEARELVKAMKGRLEVESREGLGTRFVVRLPLASTAELISTYERKNREAA